MSIFCPDVEGEHSRTVDAAVFHQARVSPRRWAGRGRAAGRRLYLRLRLRVCLLASSRSGRILPSALLQLPKLSCLTVSGHWGALDTAGLPTRLKHLALRWGLAASHQLDARRMCWHASSHLASCTP